MAHDVFISYAIEDRSVADAVCKALEERGVRCWYAPRNVPYAVDYEEAIVDAISESKLMLLILSAHANNSMHVKREVQNACREEPQIPVLPFQIADVPLSKSFRYYIGSVQWLVASTPPLEDHLQKLVNYVQERLPQPEPDRVSGTPSGQSVQAQIVEKDEEEGSRLAEKALRLAEEVERRRVEEEERLAAEAEARRKAEEERQRREAEEKRRAEEEEAQRRLAEEEAARLAMEEQRREEEERESREAEERQRLEAEEAARQQAEEERVRAEAESRKRAEQEAERQRVEAEQEAERRRLEEEKQARAEEERQRREEEERQKREAAKIKQRRAEEAARQEKERRAEERRTSEARFRELNLAAEQARLDKSSTKITAGDMPTPANKNRRVVLIAVASLAVLVIAALIWLTQRGSGSRANINQSAATQPSAATPPSPVKASPTPGPTVRNRIGMELVQIPPGEFMMGWEGDDLTERPVHRVTIRQGFYMGKYEVTQAEWQAVMGNNPSNIKGDRLPVQQVSWYDAKNFIRKLNAMGDGFTYYLPTEAQWEYAARAGTKTNYYWGDDVTQVCRYANVGDQTAKDKDPSLDYIAECRDGYAEASPVGSFQPNAFGLYDMTGNVFEWCEDYYHVNYNGAPTDGSAWLSGGESNSRVLRSSSWDWGRLMHRLTSRMGSDDPRVSESSYGLRVVAVARR